MPSPFPGMNPYLEQPDVWHDFHDDFLPRLREQVAAQLPPHYIAKLDEHLYIREPPASERTFLGRGDVFAAVRPMASAAAGAVAVAPTAAPSQVVLRQRVDFETIPFIEIRDRRDRQIVAVLELLSPTNKYSGPDREQYLYKRDLLLRSRSHFVELDLLRGGPRMPFEVPPQPCAYYALVSRLETRPRADCWPIQLAERLPVIPVPLREPDPDVTLDLQAALHAVYDAARYANYLYEMPPQPALSAEEVAWARSYLPQ